MRPVRDVPIRSDGAQWNGSLSRKLQPPPSLARTGPVADVPRGTHGEFLGEKRSVGCL